MDSEGNIDRKDPGKSKVSKGPDLVLRWMAALLIGASILVIFSASSFRAVNLIGDSAFYLNRHLLRVAIGVAALIYLARGNTEKIRLLAYPVLIFSLIGLVVLAIPGMVEPVKGSRRFISILGQSMQPSEFAKFGLILFLAGSIAKEGKEDMPFATYFYRLLFIGTMGGLIILEPDFSTGMLICLTGVFILYIGGAKYGHLALTALVGVPLIWKLALTHKYQLLRIEQWWAGLWDPDKLPHQVKQSLIALGDGGVFGKGIGDSMQKKYFLPEPFTDFIFSIWGEETGFIGSVAIVVIFIVIAFRGMRIAAKAPDKFGFLAAAGCSFAITIYAFSNLMVVTGIVPVSGLPLPIITYGGSSLIVTLCMIGVMLNISRHAEE